LGDVLGRDGCGELAEESLASQARGCFDPPYVTQFGAGHNERAEQAPTAPGPFVNYHLANQD